MKQRLLIIAAPSGAGKNTFINQLKSDFPDRVVHSISYTTRKMRDGEVEGNPYHFVSTADFEAKIKEGFFVEHEKVHQNYYGTSKSQLENFWSEKKWVVMDVDVKGAANLKKIYPEARSFFILPPSIDVLRQRIMARQSNMDDLELRLQNAVDEMLRAGEFDYRITNDVFEKAYAEFHKIVADLIKND